jgi:hypothetical protein
MALPIRLANGSTFLVETLPSTLEEVPVADDLRPRGTAMGDRPAVALPAKEFREAAEVVEGIAEELTERLSRDKKRARLSELGLEVQVGFDAKGNVFIASGSASASLKLSLKWEIDRPGS